MKAALELLLGEGQFPSARSETSGELWGHGIIKTGLFSQQFLLKMIHKSLRLC